MFKYLLPVIGALMVLMSSCTINSHLMLKTPKDYVFDSIPENKNDEYVIMPGDQLEFKLYSNGGFSVIDLTSGTKGGNVSATRLNISYLVQNDGTVKLPILGQTPIIGKSILAAQSYLEELYSNYYVDPFLQLNVVNKRVIVFPGSGNNAQIVTLQNNTVTLMEVLAQVGGITKESKSKSIKVIRKVDNGKREVYQVDLSTIDGLENADMIILADDIIYVEPNANIAREALQDITPIISLVTSTLVFYLTLKSLIN
ncbi:MAG: polysaccharide biosynthesis/export family protein [Flavobacteriales bacterium]|nr:polysaccharide biosynthesis/export family protein [Flavobacteriales bacterium]